MSTQLDLKLGQDFSEFCGTVAQSVITADVVAERPDTFRGLFQARFSRDIHVLDIAADAHSVHRTKRLVRNSPQTFLKFSVVEEGNVLIVQDGRETRLGPGDMTVYDTNRPYTLAYETAARMSVIMFPKDQLDIPGNLICSLTARKMNSESGTGAIIRPFATSLTENVNGLNDFQARRLYRSAIDLIGTLFDDCLQQFGLRNDERALLNSIYQYIEDNLDDPGLNPVQIAAANYVSVRYLHMLFSQQQTTVSAMVRTRRLQNAYDDIINPLLGNRTIHAIALKYGFADAAHFSRLFRNYFAMSPSEMRKRHLGNGTTGQPR